MPGLSLFCGSAAAIDEEWLARLEGQEAEGSPPGILLRQPHLVVTASSYPAYPIETHEDRKYVSFIEGMIYNAPGSRGAQVGAIGEGLLSRDSARRSRAARELALIDGEFVAVLQDRATGDIVVFADALGRLPLYVHTAASAAIVSRSFRLACRAMHEVRVDRLGVAESLVYGYPLGPRTLVSGVERLGAGVAIEIRSEGREVRRVSVDVPSVAPKRRSFNSSVRDIANECAAALVEACDRRARARKGAVLGLSGGLDSRCVAAALVRGGVEFKAVTRWSGSDDVEVHLAGKVASALSLEWARWPTSRGRGRDLRRLLEIRGGMNNLGMGFIVPVFESLRTRFGSQIVFFTGDGGDKTLPYHGLRKKMSSTSALAHHILRGHEVLPPEVVAAITGVHVADMAGELEARIRSYPEEEDDDKYEHFLIFERAFKLLFEGEDRNRQFFWSTTPFYGREAFEAAMRCPRQYKADYALYRAVIESLDEKLVDVESTTCGTSLKLDEQPIRRSMRAFRGWARDRAPMTVRRGVRRLKQRGSSGAAVACITKQLSGGAVVSEYLNPSATMRVLNRLTPVQVHMLLTVTSAIEYLVAGESTLEQFSEDEF